MKRRKKSERTKAKDKLWAVVSQYIRLRDCFRTTGTSQYAHCISCGTMYHFKKLDAGHFLPGRRAPVIYDEKNIHAQCVHCNFGLEGNRLEYNKAMLNLYGQGVIDELERKNTQEQTKKFKIYELVEMKEYFKKKLDNLKEGL